MQHSAPGVQQANSCSKLLRRVPHTCRRPPQDPQTLHKSLSFHSPVHKSNWLLNFPKLPSMCSRTPPIRINWDSEISGYAENTDNWIFIRKLATLAVWSSAVTIYNMYLRNWINQLSNTTIWWLDMSFIT